VFEISTSETLPQNPLIELASLQDFLAGLYGTVSWRKEKREKGRTKSRRRRNGKKRGKN